MDLQIKTRSIFPVLAVTGLLAGAQVAYCQSTANTSSAERTSVPADNSESNKMDPTNQSDTADKQSNNKSDVDITQNIRKSLMADDALSTYAHNIKVVTVGGHVTLNGVVRSEQEKSVIESKAVSVAGQGNVENQLKVSQSLEEFHRCGYRGRPRMPRTPAF